MSVRPYWLDNNDLPEDERAGLLAVHRGVVENGSGYWLSARGVPMVVR